MFNLFGFTVKEITTFLLVLARVGGIFTSAPVFGNVNVAPMVRVSIAVCLALVYLPLAKYEPSQFALLPFVLAIVSEALIGVVMGFLASLVFAAIQMAGALIDLQIGFGFANIVDPMVKERNAVIGQFQNLAATLVFLAINAHHLVLLGLQDSFVALPLGGLSISPNLNGAMGQVFGTVLLAALKISAPVVGVIFLTDVSLGILARTVPQLNVFVVGFPAKLTVGLVAVMAVMPMAMVVMAKLFGGMRSDLALVLRHLGP